MLKKFFGGLYQGEKLELVLNLPTSEATGRLQSITSSWLGISEGLVGSVSTNRIALARRTPMFRNSFKPVFVGRFVPHKDGTALVGVFRLHRFVQIFMSFWLGLAVIWTLIALLTTLSTQEYDQIFSSLSGIGMAVAGALFVKFGQFLSRNDTTLAVL